MGYLAVRLLKAFIEKDQKTIDEMLPAGTDTIDTGVRVIVPSKALRSRATTSSTSTR